MGRVRQQVWRAFVSRPEWSTRELIDYVWPRQSPATYWLYRYGHELADRVARGKWVAGRLAAEASMGT